MKRRDFLALSIESSLLAFLSQTGPALARSSSSLVPAAAKDAGETCFLNPVSQYIAKYSPPRGTWNPAKSQTATFDILSWKTGKARQDPSNPVVGELVVSRKPQTDGKSVQYEVTQTLEQQSALTGKYTCQKDLWNSLESWSFEHRTISKDPQISKLVSITESGQYRQGKLSLEQNGKRTEISCQAPLVCRWGLLDAAADFDRICQEASLFTQLHEPSGLRAGQKLQPHRKGEISGGKGASQIKAFLQTGPATLPTHWVVDSDGRPLFVTVFLVSFALKSIS